VLLVEDTPALQELVVLILKKNGIDPDTANNGLQGIEMALTGYYDLIFMDIQMPEMDGLRAIEQLRAKDYKRPIVAMTANATKRDKIDCLDAGFNDFIGKPIDKRQLRVILEKYLSKNSINCDEAIQSQVLDDEPDMLDLVIKFVATLPDYCREMERAKEAGDWSALQTPVHKLKGLGGGYGYPILTDLAADIEEMLKTNNYVLINEKLVTLMNAIQRIIRGIGQQSSD
jgi:CheY-like chemotaxis protein